MDAGFRNADARRRYLAVYDDARALSPRPEGVHDVWTPFGTVRVYQHGSRGRVPVVLIHGFYLTSAMWWEQVAPLADDFSVYTIDMLGQPGASVQSKTMLTPADCALAIDAVLQGLGLHDVHLVGHSYGGWLTTHTAARLPSRVATVTLVDPASTVARLSAKFWRNLAVLLGRPNSVRAQRAAVWVTGHAEPGSPIDTLAGLFASGFATFGPPVRTPALRFASDRLLRAVRVPVQVLLASDTVHDSTKAVQRIRSVVPHWPYRLWLNTSHALPAEVPDQVNACIRDFVIEHSCGA
ncbi:alpha/beta hydrolase [Mycolicibacterium flavescens]|uniref:alpha/beta fold hydrolase n=1 Tax=Mycobacterium neumannii TaxID=2048551 RepID=UPI000F702A87|nr:alpha/beta hydrolase [Mycobacterium neumannii]VEG41377.1 alpha/beta hydrolase [Mycolicibacterium flavescens]